MNIFNIKEVHTNVYGIARSLLAISLLITLLFTDNTRNFPIELFSDSYDTLSWNYFVVLGHENLSISIILACIILVWVVSGYLPQLSCFLHTWLAISYFDMALVIEGGDQIAQILSLLIIPVAITDRRLNHWQSNHYFRYKMPFFFKYFAFSSLVIAQVQMAIVYFFACVDKFKVDAWKDGSAFYYWFNHNPFGAPDFIHGLFGGLVLDPIVGRLITWSVLVLEAVLFAALFMDYKKKRTLLIMALSFHFTIILVHGLTSFFFAMAAGLIVYLYPVDKNIKVKGFSIYSTWAKAKSKIAQLPKIELPIFSRYK
ncbi:hypothetical protein C900_01476 [Fulvivirga imtechensis AK7]|uniref:HTTM-like domain-containing protein n=1 Tax=Fulvivirga imtechensis AK7 TaxID=1237149 RepID=L8JTZ3_9BACT|nr:sporulation-delaying protein SdpB family protein [Fulvivirga imtechensis]ELR72481.1 hypothetical protein C900_01476 [Fulvivirga imtechensis AK7]